MHPSRSRRAPRALTLACALVGASASDGVARADRGTPASPAPATAPEAPTAASCLAELDRRGIAYQRIDRPGIEIGVEVTGPLGGIRWTASSARPFLLDCSLAVSLDEAGRYLAALGISEAVYSSTYSRRNVRGTNRPSRHSYALAIDLHRFRGDALGTLEVSLDYEQGLGDAVDCLGQPTTVGGAVLRTLQCQFVYSGLFRTALSPDYDDAHHDHFHLEARRWSERAALRDERPALH